MLLDGWDGTGWDGMDGNMQTQTQHLEIGTCISLTGSKMCEWNWMQWDGIGWEAHWVMDLDIRSFCLFDRLVWGLEMGIGDGNTLLD